MRYLPMKLITQQALSFWLAALTLLFAAQVARAEPYKAQAGPYQVETYLLDLHDAKRERDVPVKVYLPVGAQGPRPVMLVSHGLGGTREGLSYLGNHWASYGYLCVHMQHVGSDDSVWRDVPLRDRMDAMRKATQDPTNATNRAGDTTFVLDELTRFNSDKADKLFGKIDLAKAGIAGHSFGAWTCLAAGGLSLGGVRATQLNDERILCMIPLSPPVVAAERLYERSYKTLSIPALFMTGTLDVSPVNDTTAEERLIPYKFMPGVSAKGAPKYQINFDGADHMTFSGETRGNKLLRKADPKTDPVFHDLILQSTTAFIDCYLQGDDKAKNWLTEGGFVKAVGERGTVEMDVK